VIAAVNGVAMGGGFGRARLRHRHCGGKRALCAPEPRLGMAALAGGCIACRAQSASNAPWASC
jgi:enoyl-CoA hydratase/carnithine racemase